MLAESETTKAMLAEEGLADQWAKEIARGDYRSVRATFASRGAQGPEIVWHPSIDLITAAPLRFMLAHWAKLAGSHDLPPAARIDPIEMREALGYVSLLDVVDGGRDFRYRLHGTIVAEASEFDMTGQYLSAFQASPYIVAFSMASHRAPLIRRAPLFSEHSPPADVSRTVWQRLTLPFVDEEGRIIRLLTCNVPTPRDGRPIIRVV